jgi:hypothetical protein
MSSLGHDRTLRPLRRPGRARNDGPAPERRRQRLTDPSEGRDGRVAQVQRLAHRHRRRALDVASPRQGGVARRRRRHRCLSHHRWAPPRVRRPRPGHRHPSHGPRNDAPDVPRRSVRAQVGAPRRRRLRVDERDPGGVASRRTHPDRLHVPSGRDREGSRQRTAGRSVPGVVEACVDRRSSCVC